MRQYYLTKNGSVPPPTPDSTDNDSDDEYTFGNPEYPAMRVHQAANLYYLVNGRVPPPTPDDSDDEYDDDPMDAGNEGADNAMEGALKRSVFKSQLHQFAQKVGYPSPVYQMINEGPSHGLTFTSIVTVNEVSYKSLPGCYNRKAAEQSAAEVALAAIARSGFTFQPVHETGISKNMLQEYAQKMNYAIPIYDVVHADAPSGVTRYSCTVTIGEVKYTGGTARTKKEAEIKAASTALLAIRSS